MSWRQRASRLAPGVAAAASAVFWTGGCASPGVPKPPSLHLPALVHDLTAVRQGGSVFLHFSAPDETTDHQPLVHKGVAVPLVAEVCRVQGAKCIAVARIGSAPGQAYDAVDALPPALTVGPGRPVEYRVRVENPAGRDAGYSKPVAAAAGAAPPPVGGLAATTVQQGIQLTWQPVAGVQGHVRVEAISKGGDGNATSLAGNSAAQSGKLTTRLLQVPSGSGDPGGAIDPAPVAGTRVEYRVYRERTVQMPGQSLPLRSAIATIHTVRSEDIFPPGAPKGLLAVSFTAANGGSSVSLSWEPNTEPDVVGYYVYRATGSGPFLRITPTAVAGVSFQDSGVAPGSRIRYAVSALDRSGNEGPRSAVTEVDVR